MTKNKIQKNKVPKDIEYHVYAKFLGTYMPEKSVKIGDCIISKECIFFDDDRMTIPVRDKSSEFHLLKKGLQNFIVYPQEPVSVRTFESEYIIKTKIVSQSEYFAVREAKDIFFDISTALSIVAKNKEVQIRDRKRKVDYETYDFEIVAIFVEKNNKLIRLKLPDVGVCCRNFFPKNFPQNFIEQANKYLEFEDSIFKKGLVYFQRATTMHHSGVFDELDIMLNFVKCIELICDTISTETKCNLTSNREFEKQKKKDGMKWIYQCVGEEIGVDQKFIDSIIEAWRNRNNNDVAHGHEYYNPVNKLSNILALVNYEILEACTAEFLRKYYEYKSKQ